MIVQSKDIAKPIRESADVCIIGSGCGGGPSAKILAEAGKKVVVIEEGGSYKSEEFVPTEEWAFTNLYQQRAGQATTDLSVTILQGRMVGGSTPINWMTSLRTPEFVLDAWTKLGLSGYAPKEMEPHFASVENYLNIHPEPDENHNRQNKIILEGAKKLGYRTHLNGRNHEGCIQAGVCGFGCPTGAKKSVDVTYIADAVQRGATVFSDCRAEKIEVRGTMKRVSGFVLDRPTRKPRFEFSIEAPIVIVAGSAIQSPLLLQKSGLTNAHIGKHLTFHLTTAVFGEHTTPMYPWKGIPQSAFCNEFVNKNGDGGGFWIEAVPATAVLTAMALPGFGQPHREKMKLYPNAGASIVLVKEIDSEGSVTPNDFGRPTISYKVGPRDLEYLKQGIAAAARIHFAAGAKSVMTLHARQTVFNSPSEIEKKLDDASWGTNELSLFSAHPLGTCRMGKDLHSSVVNSVGQSHDVKGLFVIDGSVTPTSLGVNPMVTLLAIAEKNAKWVAENWQQI
jgi:choline dehydrogenase-like flavoprotein